MSQEVYLNAVSAFLPNAPVTNTEMEAVLGKIGDVPSRVKKMILRSNGILTRHYAIDPKTRHATHTGTELAAEAVKLLFDSGSLKAKEIGSLACGTSYPDQILPGQGVMLHGLLPEIPPCEVVSHAGVCVAGMAAMKHAFNAVKTGEFRHAVSVASETPSAVMRSERFQGEIESKDWHHARAEIGFEKDFLRWMLSDGAGAAYLSCCPNAASLSFKIHWIDLVSYAGELPVCMYAGGEIRKGRFEGWKNTDEKYCTANSLMAVKQDVKLLNDNIVPYTVEKALLRLIDKYSLRAAEVDWLLPHYSSVFFRDKLLQGLQNIGFEIPQSKWFTNLTEKGNTGSASIYIILEEFMRTKPLRHGQKILCYIPESGRFSSCFMLLEAVLPQSA